MLSKTSIAQTSGVTNSCAEISSDDRNCTVRKHWTAVTKRTTRRRSTRERRHVSFLHLPRRRREKRKNVSISQSETLTKDHRTSPKQEDINCADIKRNNSCVTWQKNNKAHYEVLRQILSILLELHIWCLRGVPQQHWRKVFKLFQIYSYADTSWDDDRNSCKSTCCSCRMPFHMHSLMSWNGLLRC